MAVLSDQALYALVQKHFGDLGAGVVNTMFQIAKRESGGNPAAYNGQGMDNSWGLFQINTIAGANPDMLKYNLTDPEQNARAAREVYDRAGPSAWSTYGGGGGSVPPADQSQDPTEIIQHVINALTASQPQLSDFQDQPYNPAQEQYQAAYQEWLGNLTDALKMKKDFTDEASGIFTLGDGTVITQAQMDAFDPATRAQVETQLANQNVDRQNKYNDLMNNLGLTEFQTGQNSAELENSRRSADFQNQLGTYREQLGLDQANQNTALNKIDRQLNGMSEARARSTAAMEALQKAAPWGTTNGKTSFSAADLGGGVANLSRFGNMDPNASLLNFTGTQTVDPNATFNFYDQQLGVGGPLPQVPDLTTTPGMIPQAPGSIPIQQGAPAFNPYTPPVTQQVPQASPPPPVDINAAVAAIQAAQQQQGAPQQQVASPAMSWVPIPPLVTPISTAVQQYLRR